MKRNLFRPALAAAFLLLNTLAAGCGSGGNGPVGLSFTVTSDGLTVARGGTGIVTGRITNKVDLNSEDRLSVSGLPNGVTGTFDTPLLPATGDTATLTIKAAATAPTGQFDVTVNGVEVDPHTGQPQSILLMNPDGTNLHALPTPSVANFTGCSSPRYSRDGHSIVFVASYYSLTSANQGTNIY